jgi:hypothetical protein
MALASLAFALLLAAQGPAVADQPVSTSNDETAEQLSQREAMAYAVKMPAELPSDDVGFVGWCAGIVGGHVETGRFLNDSDQELLSLGEEERRKFETALAAAAAREGAESLQRAQAARALGEAHWARLREGDRKQTEFAYGTFGLPGRCEHAARRVTQGITTPPARLSPLQLEAMRQAGAPMAADAPQAQAPAVAAAPTSAGTPATDGQATEGQPAAAQTTGAQPSEAQPTDSQPAQDQPH